MLILRTGKITLRGQIPCDLPKDAKIVPHLEPLKDRDEGETRSFPITEEALPIFLRLRQEQADQRRLCKLGGVKYYDNDLVVCKPDGSPYLQKRISVKFNGFMRSTGMPKIRFHDLRGTAGTNMYNLTGDFYAVSQYSDDSVDEFSHVKLGVNLKINTDHDPLCTSTGAAQTQCADGIPPSSIRNTEKRCCWR